MLHRSNFFYKNYDCIYLSSNTKYPTSFNSNTKYLTLLNNNTKWHELLHNKT